MKFEERLVNVFQQCFAARLLGGFESLGVIAKGFLLVAQLAVDVAHFAGGTGNDAQVVEFLAEEQGARVIAQGFGGVVHVLIRVPDIDVNFGEVHPIVGCLCQVERFGTRLQAARVVAEPPPGLADGVEGVHPPADVVQLVVERKGTIEVGKRLSVVFLFEKKLAQLVVDVGDAPFVAQFFVDGKLPQKGLLRFFVVVEGHEDLALVAIQRRPIGNGGKARVYGLGLVEVVHGRFEVVFQLGIYAGQALQRQKLAAFVLVVLREDEGQVGIVDGLFRIVSFLDMDFGQLQVDVHAGRVVPGQLQLGEQVENARVALCLCTSGTQEAEQGNGQACPQENRHITATADRFRRFGYVHVGEAQLRGIFLQRCNTVSWFIATSRQPTPLCTECSKRSALNSRFRFTDRQIMKIRYRRMACVCGETRV